MTTEELKNLAITLATDLESDIIKARGREEHIRVSARAISAQILLNGINQMFDNSDSDEAE